MNFASWHVLLRFALMLTVLVVIAIVGQHWLVLGQHELDRQQSGLHHLKSELQEKRRATGSPAQDERLVELFRQMDSSDGLPSRLRRLDTLLQANRLSLRLATYQMKAGKPGGIGRYEIQAEVEGPYYGLRFFLRALFAADAFLALDSLEVSRPADALHGQSLIRSRLRFVMFVKEPAE